MENKVTGVAHDTLITTNLGIVPVQHLGVTLEDNVVVKPRLDFRVKNRRSQWVEIDTVTKLGYLPARDFEIDDGRSFSVGINQEVWSSRGFISGVDLKLDDKVELRREGILDYNEIQSVNGLHPFPLTNNNLSFMKLLGMLTAFGRIIPETGVIGLMDIPPRLTIEFTSLMESLFNFTSQDCVKTKQTEVKVNLHYQRLGLASWLGGLLVNGIPFEVMSSSEPEMLMFLKGLHDPKYNQVQSRLNGSKYIYNKKNYIVARQVFSMVRCLGYTPKMVKEDDDSYSVLTIGVNVTEDPVDIITRYNNITSISTRITGAFNYSDLLYKITLKEGTDFIVDGLVLSTGN